MIKSFQIRGELYVGDYSDKSPMSELVLVPIRLREKGRGYCHRKGLERNPQRKGLEGHMKDLK